MKIVFSFQKNNLPKLQKTNLTFEGGLTTKMVREIRRTDPIEISSKLAQEGIPNDLQGNKVVAWCCDKTVDIFKQLNERFGLDLVLPQKIYVEDFRRLNVDRPDMYGFCNLAPTELKKDSDEIVPSRVVFFNTLHNWNDIDSISDRRYETKHSGTNFFLDIFFHEFSHVMHENRLLDLYDGETLLKKLESIKIPQQVFLYRRKHASQVAQICNYALANPLEAVACDLSRRITNSIDKERLVPVRNPFSILPYKDGDLSLLERLQCKINPLNEILRDFWNGKFD